MQEKRLTIAVALALSFFSLGVSAAPVDAFYYDSDAALWKTASGEKVNVQTGLISGHTHSVDMASGTYHGLDLPIAWPGILTNNGKTQNMVVESDGALHFDHFKPTTQSWNILRFKLNDPSQSGTLLVKPNISVTNYHSADKGSPYGAIAAESGDIVFEGEVMMDNVSRVLYNAQQKTFGSGITALKGGLTFKEKSTFSHMLGSPNGGAIGAAGNILFMNERSPLRRLHGQRGLDQTDDGWRASNSGLLG